jgi:hypothetical protein
MDSGILKIQDSILIALLTLEFRILQKLFLEAQGYNVDKKIVYQDNKSAILLETNGKKSLGKRTGALNNHYFFITDQVEKGNAQIEHCGTNNMAGDFFTKPLQGKKFQRFWNNILGC